MDSRGVTRGVVRGARGREASFLCRLISAATMTAKAPITATMMGVEASDMGPGV